MKKSVTIVVVLIVAGLVLGTLIIQTKGALRVHSSRGAEHDDTNPISDAESRISLASDSPDDIGAILAAAVESILFETAADSEASKSYAQSVEAVTVAYLSSTYDQLLDYMIFTGIEPPDILLSQPEQAESMWSIWHQFVSTAALDPASVVVRSGNTLDAPEPGYGNRTAVREGSRPSVEHLPENTQSGTEVVVKATFRDSEGTPFSARLGLTFVRSANGQWVLVRTNLYSVPNGVATPSIPI